MAVALRKESVDRNTLYWLCRLVVGSSLSARRAWIEIDSAVDSASGTLSLSARRAWIEMGWRSTGYLMTYVALRKESVDRNPIDVLAVSALPGRSPQGERG